MLLCRVAICRQVSLPVRRVDLCAFICVLRLDIRQVNAQLCAHGGLLMQHETNTGKIIARLLREGWQDVGGKKHAKFRKGGHSPILVPRHKTVTPGVAKSIAKAAGWAK